MAFAIYKPGQGYWTRMLSGIGAATLLLAGVAWLWAQLQGVSLFDIPTLYLQAGVAVILVAGLGGLIYWLLNKPSIVDFMIATEAEMKKVNWPTRREIFGSTVVVIVGTLMLALLLTVIDFGFGWLFIQFGVLEATQAS